MAPTLEATLHRHVFPTRQQLVIVLAIVAPLKLLISPLETIRAWRG